MGKKEKEKTTKKCDLKLLAKIQPQGGITFRDESVIKTGTGYEACLMVYEYPKEVNKHWMSNLCNIANTVTLVDVSTYDTIEAKKNLNKSMKEQNLRYQTAADYQERYDSQRKFAEMQQLMMEIDSMGEVVKGIQARLFVSDRQRAKLEEKVAKIMATLESNGYKTAVFLNENRSQWLSMLQPYREQQKNPYSIEGQPLVSEAVAGGYPFHFSKLEDPTGTFLGTTSCGGNVLFDEFTKTKTRRYYNSLVVGTMGSGKSTLLKKRFVDRAIRGDYVRVFDVTGEFSTLTDEFGGKIIKMDGSNGMLNPLEILKAGENENVNFARHMSKISTEYRFLRGLKPGEENEEVTEFQHIMREIYESYRLTPETIEDGEHITGLPADKYPRFSDVLQYIRTKINLIEKENYNDLEKEIAKQELLTLEKIRKIIENIVNTYGFIVDGYTSMDNILDEQIVTFDISEVKEMAPEIFDAIIFNTVSLCWDNCVTNGTIMKDKYDKGAIKFEDVVRFLIIIDESHRWINAQKLQAVQMITVYLREARKFFGGIMMASQSIRDYVPEGSADAAINQIKSIFELTQYKFIFQQDSNTLSLIDKVFENVLTSSQRNQIPYLEQGQNILCISSQSNLAFTVHLTKDEERIFAGGA